jgi:hypothetical protein
LFVLSMAERSQVSLAVWCVVCLCGLYCMHGQYVQYLA